METINWTNYSGIEFQQFCNALLSMEIGKAFIPFNAPGRDKGIDGLYIGVYQGKSGKWRFQYKFHSTPRSESVSLLKTDLRKEISNISDEQHFVLLTNVELLPQDRERLLVDWEKNDLNPSIEIWDGAKISTLYLQYPILLYWLSSGFSTSQLQDYKVAFKRNLESDYSDPGTFTNPFEARDVDIAKLTEFLNSASNIVLISGEAGIGKTRLVVEFFNSVVSVLHDWVPLVLMNRNVDFDKIQCALSGDKCYLILVDDAHEFSPDIISDIERLSSITNGRIKIVLTARQLSASKLLRIIKKYDKQKILQIHLDALSRGETKKLLKRELDGNYYFSFLSELVSISHGRPILIVAIIRAIRSGVAVNKIKGDDLLKTYVKGYFESFYEEITALTGIAKLKLQRLLQMVCLIEPFSYDNQIIIDQLAEITQIESGTIEVILKKLLENQIASGRYIQSIKPDYYSDIILEDVTPKTVSKELPRFKGFLNNMIINLCSLDENATRNSLLLDGILQDFSDKIENDDAQQAATILDTLAQLAYVKPGISAKTLRFWISKVEDNKSNIYASIGDSVRYQNYLDSLPASVKQILLQLLYHKDQQKFVFDQLFRLFYVFKDSKSLLGVFGFSKRDYVNGYTCKLQEYFVSTFRSNYKQYTLEGQLFGVECLRRFLVHDFNSSDWEGGSKSEITITTYYIPNRSSVHKMRKNIIQGLIQIFKEPNDPLLKKEIFKELLDIPRGILASTRNPTAYKGNSEIQLILVFLVSVVRDLLPSLQKEALEKIFWYRKWGISQEFNPSLQEIEKLLQSQNLTQELVHLFVRSETTLTPKVETKFVEKAAKLIGEASGEDLAESIIEIGREVDAFILYFSTFLTVLIREFPAKAKVVYSIIFLREPKLIIRFGNLFLSIIYFEEKESAFYWSRVSELKNLNVPEADNAILLIYCYKDFDGGEFSNDDLNLITEIALKGEAYNNHYLSRTLPNVIVNDPSIGADLSIKFLGRCVTRDADTFFRYLSMKMDNQYPICKKLVLDFSLKFPIGYDIELCLSKIIKNDGVSPIFNYLQDRFKIKVDSTNKNSSSPFYDLVPSGEHSHLFDGCAEGIQRQLFMAKVEWFVELDVGSLKTLFASRILEYLRPGKIFDDKLQNEYERIIPKLKRSHKKLCKLIETLIVFHFKDKNLIQFIIKIFLQAEKLCKTNEKALQTLGRNAYDAITTVGVKSGTSGQPFGVDVRLKELLNNEITKYDNGSSVYLFLKSIIADLSKKIDSSYDDSHQSW